jgi:hypothetical protein
MGVQIFSSFMEGAPQLSNTHGAMTAVLDAVLVNGFNLKTINSITQVEGVATATVLLGHLYQVNQSVLIEGAVESAYNGEKRVLSVTSTTFTFAVTGNPASPATGSITCNAASLGWEIAFTGTNKRAYRSKSAQSARPYLRVDDGLSPLYTTTYAKKAKVTMAQDMTGIDTFQGTYAPYDATAPTKGEIATGSGPSVIDGWFKWYYARAGGASNDKPDSDGPNTLNRQWFIVGDERGFYLFNENLDGTGGLCGHCFTDFESYRAGDSFNTILCATDSYTQANSSTSSWPLGSEGYRSSDNHARFPRMLDSTGKLVLRSFTQLGGAQPVSFVSLNTGGSNVSGYSTGITYPNGPDYGVILHPVLIKEGNALRGKMPGMFWIHNDASSLDHGALLTGVAGYPGRTFFVVKVAHGTGSSALSAFMAFDITGPWW